MGFMATILTAVAGFTVTAVAGIFLIPYLKKLKFGQTILEYGPKWHAKKQGTPTMGGIMFIIGFVVAVGLGFIMAYFFDENSIKMNNEFIKLIAGIIMALLFGSVGFIDDYIKVVKKQNLGLRAMQKLVLQILITVAYLTVMYIFDPSTIVNIPFLGQWDMGFLYYPVMAILIIGIVNATNLTDGLDGLLTSNIFVVSIFFIVATAYLRLVGANIIATALASACIGFLLYNAHPAKVFMGDTGSLFMGGAIVALSFAIDMPVILFFVGFVFCFEALSVMMQVASVKLTGKRIFKMSPVHHHFEMCGWKENKIVTVFTLVTLMMCVVAFFAVINM